MATHLVPLSNPKKKQRPVPVELLCPHSSQAYGYTNFIILQRDRIRKERYADLGEERLRHAYTDPPLDTDRVYQRDFYPVGGTNKFNNNSVEVAKTLSEGTWDGAGGCKTAHQQQFGRPGMFTGGKPRRSLSDVVKSLSTPALGAALPGPLRHGPGDPRLAAQSRAHHKLLKQESTRSPELVRAMRSLQKQLVKEPSATSEGKP